MDSDSMFFTGIAPEHVPALAAALLLVPVVWLTLRLIRGRANRGSARANSLLTRWETATEARRITALLLLTTGVIHLSLPLGHEGAPALNLMFLASGVAFTALAVKSFGEGNWRFQTSLLLMASNISYLVVSGSGWQEESDQLGIATKLIELTALGLIGIPRFKATHGIRGRLMRPLASTGFVMLVVATGVVIWIGSFVAHSESGEAGDQEHSHDFAARAQAGVIMRPVTSEEPTHEQEEAAARLAEETKRYTANYVDYGAALADGYVPDGPELGLRRHLKKQAYQRDGLILEPTRPELLVYATDGHEYLLLGVAYTMENAGDPGPEIGGSLTRWHSHNICATLLPPGFGLVSPFGTCPLGSAALTGPEMMHVWTVENPDGPYAGNFDDEWVRALMAHTAGAEPHSH